MTDEKNITVRILPLKGIGGIGNAGDVVMMSAADAEMYVRDGFVEVVSGSETLAEQSGTLDSDETEDHTIIKPQAKRGKRK